MTVSISATIDAPIENVWAIISNFAGLKNWHPLVEKCEADGDSEGAVRKVYFADWWASERLERLDHARHLLRYCVTASSRTAPIGVTGTIQLTAEGDGATRVDWSSGLAEGKPFATEVNAGLAAYYPARIGHLRAALGLPIDGL